MSTAPARPSHAAVLLIAGVTVILLYFLSAPAVKYGGHYSSFGSIRPRTFDPRQADGREDLANLYATPYEWLEKHTPLGALLKPYAYWWWERAVYGPASAPWHHP